MLTVLALLAIHAGSRVLSDFSSLSRRRAG
jgi:hypothetical protein